VSRHLETEEFNYRGHGKSGTWYRKWNLYEQEEKLLIIIYRSLVPHKGNAVGIGSLRTSCSDGREGRFNPSTSRVVVIEGGGGIYRHGHCQNRMEQESHYPVIATAT
jgi:hypothetical protein